MSSSPEVSVILPTCNRCEQTRSCLEALAAQTFRDFEVVAIDDGSTDGTAVMLDAFAANRPDLSLTIVTNDTNLGANASRNRGIDRACGAILAFLDSDCIAEPDWLARLLEPFADADVAAVTGLVTDPAPRNVYELCFKGTHRVARPGPTHRLVAGNMAVRRARLDALTFDETFRDATRAGAAPDTSFSGRCDEEGIAIQLARHGHRLMAQPTAVVLHDHRYERGAFFRQAYHGGRAAAELVRHYRLPHRLDMLPFLGAYGSLAIAAALLWWSPWVLAVPIGLFVMALGALAYNDMARKGKTLIETLRSFPVLVAYYHVRLVGYVVETVTGKKGRRSGG